MVRWMRWHSPPDTRFEIWVLVVWGRLHYPLVTQATNNTASSRMSGEYTFVCLKPECHSGNKHAIINITRRHLLSLHQPPYYAVGNYVSGSKTFRSAWWNMMMDLFLTPSLLLCSSGYIAKHTLVFQIQYIKGRRPCKKYLQKHHCIETYKWSYTYKCRHLMCDPIWQNLNIGDIPNQHTVTFKMVYHKTTTL